MKQNNGNLSNADHNKMDDFLNRVLVAYKNDEISLKNTISGLAHVMAALDNGNTGEALSWFNQDDVSFFQRE
jgi:hypothetical protein